MTNIADREMSAPRERTEARGGVYFREKQVELDPRSWYLALTFAFLFLGIGVYYGVHAIGYIGKVDIDGWFLLEHLVLVVIPLSLGLFLPWWYFRRLQVKVTGEHLEVSYRLWQRRLFPLHQIASWEVRVYHARSGSLRWNFLRRFRSNFWRIYAVNGILGLEVKLANGRKIMIGSQHPDRLARALEKAKEEA